MLRDERFRIRLAKGDIRICRDNRADIRLRNLNQEAC